MNGVSALALAALDWLVSLWPRYNDQEWVMDCPYCNRRHLAGSRNVVVLKNNLHIHFRDDDRHPDATEDVGEEEWQNDTDPWLRSGTSPYSEAIEQAGATAERDATPDRDNVLETEN